MTRGGWQVQERKARQAAKASRISTPLLITLPPTKAITKLMAGCPDKVLFHPTTSAFDSVPLALSADPSPRPLEFSGPVAPTAAATVTPARPSIPVPSLDLNSLNDTLIYGFPPLAIATVATASSTPSALVNAAASIQLSRITATPFDAVISTHSDPSFIHDPAPGKPLTKRAKRKIAKVAVAATAALESSPIGELSKASGDASLAQFNSNQPSTSEELEQAAATADQLGAEMRRLFLVCPEAEGYESDEKWRPPQQHHEEEKAEEVGEEEGEEEEEEEDEEKEGEEDLESITEKVTAFRQALRNDAKAPVQNHGELQSGQYQRENELQKSIIQAEMRIADFQSGTAQAHEELVSFMTHKLARQEEASKKASRAAARIIALLIFCNCAFLGLFIAPYL